MNLKYLSLSLLLLFTVACAAAQMPAATTAPHKDGVCIHLSHGCDDPHRALMALNMASVMADDREVLVYLDIQAVHLVMADAKPLSFAHFPSRKELLATLLDKGVTVFACPGCLKVAGKTGADLMEGVKVAHKEGFFEFTQGRILSLDY